MRNTILKNTIKIFTFAFVVLCFFGYAKIQANAGEMNMHTINIGHGDAILFESQGHYMLVDSGESNATETLMAYLDKNIEGDTIDYAIATHADQDHVGGFKSVAEKYQINNYIFSEPMKNTKTFRSFEEAIDISLLKNPNLFWGNAFEGQTFTFGDASVMVIYDGRQGSTFNESSIVMKVTCDNKSVLMTGDLPTTMETKLIDKGYKFSADILKVGHHGAAASTSTEFLKKVKPEYAVIPNGMVDGVFLPKDSVLQRLATQFIKTYLATEGDIVMNVKDDVISTEHKENKKFECISRGKLTLSSYLFYAPEEVGAPVIPGVQVFSDNQLIPSSGYTVTMSKNTHTGTAKVKVTGTKKKYIGSLSTTFSILPRNTRFYTAERNGTKLALHWNAQTSCSGYEIVYATNKAQTRNVKTIIIRDGKNNRKTIKKLVKKNNYYIKIRAFTDNIGYGRWSSVKKIKKIKVVKKKKAKKKKKTKKKK